MSDFKYKTIIPDVDFWKQVVPCQAACPVKTDAGRYVQLIAQRDYEAAYLVARSPNPLASICGRVCAAPCEDACRRGRIDAPISIRALKRFVTEKYGAESMEPTTQNALFEGGSEAGNKWRWHLPVLETSKRKFKRQEKVAVIGAGPAGLGCAHDLALMGYEVTIFEASAIAGGMMYHGIPEFRLPRQVIEKEVAKIRELGVEIRYNSPLNKDFGLSELRRHGYRAVFLSVGVQKGRDLNIEGADLDGVVKAVDYLININNGYRVDLGKKVLVIGGGFVAFDAARMALRTGLTGTVDVDSGELMGGEIKSAFDAARSAIRSGATDVRMISLEALDELPVVRTTQGQEEFHEAQKEGIAFHPSRSARRFIGENGRLTKVELRGVARVFDDDGRFNPTYDDDVTETLDADSAGLASSDTEFKRFGQDDQPVTQVNWFEAVAYCHWLTRRLGAGRWLYSLPTEAEWEKVARGPDNFDYPLAQNLSDAETKLYNWRKNPLSEVTVVGTGETRERYPPNRYGVYHLGGNVVEWTQGLYSPFNREKPYDAEDGRNREDASGVRVVRGGSWYSASNALMYIPYRDTFQPEISHNDLGFRIVVRSLMH